MNGAADLLAMMAVAAVTILAALASIAPAAGASDGGVPWRRRMKTSSYLDEGQGDDDDDGSGPRR